MQRESFTSGGRRISVATFAPAGGKRHPGVLVLHSAAGTLVGKGELERFSRALATEGKVAFLVRYFDRTGTIFAGGAEIDRSTDIWMETVKHAVDFAVAHPRVRADRIGAFGYSLGAYLAVTHSSLDPRIDAVAEVAGGIFSGYEGGMRRLPPTLILHGSADQRVRVSEAHRLQRAAKRFGAPVQIKIYEGEGHRLSRSAAADASRRALEFLGRHLQQPQRP
jgi:carboxymethylenebutenolidase